MSNGFYSTQKLNTVIRENSILSANSAFFFKDAAAGGGLAQGNGFNWGMGKRR
jgi:hypothetical protein